ncbi:RPA-related protein RADX-like [Dreissena polymorpha]|uniref:RPA-related protein RADX-like n=1 Tax=Dreissena polymorpha TaxID=45954 RepID=UPI002263DBB5|nr:RPA-related protein RADX-like [Dreissena polymorpha]
MAQKLKCGKLQDLRKCIRAVQLSDQTLESDDFLVLAVQRYLADPKHWAQVGICDGNQKDMVLDVIEVVLTDGEYKVKVILAPELNSLIQTCQLQAGSHIVITSAHVHFDETDIDSGKTVIVKGLTVTGYGTLPGDKDLSRLQWADDCSPHEQTCLPLTSSRGYHVSVWSTMEMCGDCWKMEATLSGLPEGVEAKDIYGIKDLARSWGSVRASNPALLVRVQVKSRMIHYAKPSKNDKWPFQAHLLVADKTGACTAVLWNAMCPQLYHSIKEGTVLFLRKFTTKKSFNVPRIKAALKNTQLFDIDLNINSHHPETEVKVIHESRLPDGIELPNRLYNFVNRRQVGCLPDNHICDIAGMVTYVGRYEREPINNKFGRDTGGFWVRRWIQLQDGTSCKPFHLQLYKVAEIAVIGFKIIDLGLQFFQSGIFWIWTRMANQVCHHSV